MEREAATLDREFKTIEQDWSRSPRPCSRYSYLGKLLGNARVVRYLAQFHPDILSEFQKIADLRKAT